MALSKRKISPYFLFGLLLLLAWVSFRIVAVFLDWVLIGLFLAYLTYPVYLWIKDRVRNAPLASLLMLLGISGLVLAPLVFLAIQLVREIENLLVALNVRSVAAFERDVAAWLNDFMGRTAQGDQAQTLELIREARQQITTQLGHLVTTLPGAVVQGTIGMFVLLYVMYYAYKDGPRLMAYIREALPMQESHRDHLFEEIGNVVRAVMYGSVLTALIQAVIGGIGFFLFGVPGVIFWSVVMFVLALLPVIGPPLVWIPASIYLFLTGHTFQAVGLFIYGAILVSSIDNLIRPKLIGSRAHVHPVVILLGVLGGVLVLGFSGFLIGPLVLAIFVTLVDVYRREFALKMTDEGDSLAGLG